jgi:hypothetical protein
MSDSRLYLTWLAMRRRCKDPKNEFYENYGGRGIKVCERWDKSFQTFFDDMGLPKKGMTLERKDNNGDYSPENCRWATAKEQARNRRANRKITVKGQTLCVAEWAELSRISHSTIVSRLGRGWPEHLAVTVPPRSLRRSPESPQ